MEITLDILNLVMYLEVASQTKYNSLSQRILIALRYYSPPEVRTCLSIPIVLLGEQSYMICRCADSTAKPCDLEEWLEGNYGVLGKLSRIRTTDRPTSH